jgi:hypothetical protein
MLAPGRYVLSAKAYFESGGMDDNARVLCELVGTESGMLDATVTFVPKNRPVPLVLASVLDVGDLGDVVRVACSTQDAATPTAMSVKLIALQVGEP